jgi:hypothetical protein
MKPSEFLFTRNAIDKPLTTLTTSSLAVSQCLAKGWTPAPTAKAGWDRAAAMAEARAVAERLESSEEVLKEVRKVLHNHTG